MEITFELVGDKTREQLIRRAHEVFKGYNVNDCILYAIEAVERSGDGQVVALITSPKNHQGIVYYDRKITSYDMDLPIYKFIYANVDSIHEYDMGSLKSNESFPQFLKSFEPTRALT